MRHIAVLLLLLALAACAGAEMPAPALAFADAASEGARLAEAQARARAEVAAALRRAVVASRGDQVLLRGADCRPGAAPHACVPRLGQAQAPLDRLPADSAAGRSAPILAYAQALSALAAADSAAARAAAEARMAAALAGLGAPAQAPGSGLGGAIAAADSPLQRALADLAAVVAGQREATADDRAGLLLRLVAQYNAMSAPAAEGAAGAAAREALLGRIALLAAAQRQLLAADPVADLRALGPAHQRLRRLADASPPDRAALAAELSGLAARLRRAAADAG
jgi:hypothetical protein